MSFLDSEKERRTDGQGGKGQTIVTKSLFTVKLKLLSVLLLLLNPVRYSRVVGGSLSTDSKI